MHNLPPVGTVVHDPSPDVLTMADVLSTRIKELLGRAIEAPETLDPSEVREMAASVVFCLAALHGG